MKIKKGLIFVHLISMSVGFPETAFAVCEQERAELAEWTATFEKLSAASCVAGTAGGLFAVVTLGLSMAPCAALSATAANADRIKHEKAENLKRCEEREKARARAQQEAAENAKRELESIQVQADLERTRLARIARQDRENEIRRRMIQADDEKMHQWIQNCVAEGWEMNHPEAQERIRAKRLELEQARDLRIQLQLLFNH